MTRPRGALTVEEKHESMERGKLRQLITKLEAKGETDLMLKAMIALELRVISKKLTEIDRSIARRG